MNSSHSVMCIAELSANHNHSIDRAKEIIAAVAAAGADAVKIQTYTADTLTIDCENEYFILTDGLWAGRTLYDLYSEAYTPWEWHEELQQCAHAHGLQFFSTPFDASAVDFLEELNVAMYKVASFELVDIPLLKRIGNTSKPVLLSTGMATIDEIQEAIQTLRDAGSGEITILKCTSAYPAKPEEANLLTIPDMMERFGCKVGLSDHTLGSVVAVAAVALGAAVVEKHFTLNRAGGGPDDSFSMEPAEFAKMVKDIRVAERSRGDVRYGDCGEQKGSVKFRRSIFAVEDIQEGEEFTLENTRVIRPGNGLHPRYYEALLGTQSPSDIKRGSPVLLEALDV